MRYNTATADEDVLVLKMDDDLFQKIDLVLKNKIKDYFIELLISRLDRMNEAVSSIANFAHTRTLAG
jgi:CRP-like cAMP-binding protein